MRPNILVLIASPLPRAADAFPRRRRLLNVLVAAQAEQSRDEREEARSSDARRAKAPGSGRSGRGPFHFML